MDLTRAFRLSSYLTLALACACLGYAELPFLPATPFLLIAWAAFLLLAYFLEGRWSLSAWAANLLGIAIFAVTICWTAYLYSLALSGRDWNGIPWPAVLLPHAGPLLMLLLLAKLFRPKRLADYWFLQRIGFFHVALACVLAADPVFGLLLFAYLASGIWCLSLLQMYDSQEQDHATPKLGATGPRRNESADGNRVPLPWLGLRHALRWALGVAFLGVILFLVIPRSSGLLWDPGNITGSGHRLSTGFTSDIDVGASGTVQVSDEVAFEVTVVDARGRPKVDLSATQRWRGATLSFYDIGRWYPIIPPEVDAESRDVNGIGVPPPRGHRYAPLGKYRLRHTHTNERLPDLGDTQYFLTFTIDRQRAGGFFLAEPVILTPGKPSQPYRMDHPYQSRGGNGLDYLPVLFFEMDGTLSGLPSPARGQFSYKQVTRPPPQGHEDWSVPRWLFYNEAAYVHFNQYPIPDLRKWTYRLLKRLAAEGRYGLRQEHLALEGGDPRSPRRSVEAPLQARNFEMVARALERFFATSGEYTYSLNLARSGKHKDPTMDFLLEVKTGHCTRFASALALVLRSVGIPTRVVNGFQGAEHQGDGHYVVRQSFAHTWVEALVTSPKRGSKPGWLALNPTPPVETARAEGFDWTRFWGEAVTKLQALWQSFIVDFNPEQQREALAGLWALLAPGKAGTSLGAWLADSYSGPFWAKPGFWLLTVLAGAVLAVSGRRFRSRGRRARSKPPVSDTSIYGKLLTILDRRFRLRPRPAQTPRELAGAAGRLLLEAPGVSSPTSADLAGLPARVAALFYRDRYGGQPLSADELRETERQLEELDRALVTPARPVRPMSSSPPS
jgi:hypothetical protein